MAKKLLALVAFLAVMIGTAVAQDAKAVLQAAAKNIGADNIKTIQISGTGMTAAVGQSYSPTEDWPRFDVTKYTRTIDYDAKSSREELTRRQGSNPPRGGGGTPLQGEQQQVAIVSGNYAWNMQANNANPAPAAAEVRQLEIWLTPHGFLKAAMAGNPTAITVTVAGPSTPGMTQGGRKAVIGEVNKLIPNKPIRYVVSTHHHFDHSGGLRTYAAQGATIVTHQGNREFYEQVVFSPAPWTLQPDRLAAFYPYSANNRTPAIETVNQKYVLSDGVRTMDLYPVQGLAHASTMLMVYLPKEKILVNADLYTPPAPGAPPPASNPNIVTLNQNIQRLKLDVAQHVPIHGGVGTAADFLKIVGNPSN